MDNKILKEAKDEAQRFIQRADDVLEAEKDNKFIYFGTRRTGAVRRASLDLSRVLSELRKP